MHISLVAMFLIPLLSNIFKAVCGNSRRLTCSNVTKYYNKKGYNVNDCFENCNIFTTKCTLYWRIDEEYRFFKIDRLLKFLFSTAFSVKPGKMLRRPAQQKMDI